MHNGHPRVRFLTAPLPPSDLYHLSSPATPTVPPAVTTATHRYRARQARGTSLKDPTMNFHHSFWGFMNTTAGVLPAAPTH